MSVSWKIEGALILLESDENASFGEWVTAFREAGESSHWRSGLNVVHDLRRVRELPGAIDTMLRMEFLIARGEALGIARYASVIGENQLPGEGSLAEGFAEGKAVLFRVFRDWAAAVAWASPNSIDS